MEGTVLFDYVDCYLSSYRKELENKADELFSDDILKEREELKKFLNDKQLKLVDSYAHSLVLREEEISIQYEIKLLNTGVKIGMQLLTAFNEDDNR